MRNHGVSHGAAVLVCAVSSGVLVQLLRLKLPEYLQALNYFSSLLVFRLNLPFDAEDVGMIILTAILSFIWGAAFAVLHEDVPSRK